jgi:hypothetical protein
MKKSPFSNASIGSVVLVLTGIGAGLTFGAHAKTNRVTLGLLSEELPAIRSQLSTSPVSGSDTYRTVFSFPGIETADRSPSARSKTLRKI